VYTLIGNLKLTALLCLTLLLVRRGQKRSPRIAQLMREDSFVLQIQTRSGRGGHFVLRDACLALHLGLHPAPDYVQSWIDGNAACAVLTSRDETEMLRAVEDGRLRMRGRFLVALWFNEVMKLARDPRTVAPT
jgi:hypothetical protein